MADCINRAVDPGMSKRAGLGLVRVDSLARGDVFECVSGRTWTVKDKSGNVTWVTGEAGEDCFCNSAMVRKVL